jgi:hypothetical protein
MVTWRQNRVASFLTVAHNWPKAPIDVIPGTARHSDSRSIPRTPSQIATRVVSTGAELPLRFASLKGVEKTLGYVNEWV